MKGKIIALIVGTVIGIIKTVLFSLYLFKVKCKSCKKKKRLKEIVKINKDLEITGQHCSDCQKKDRQEKETGGLYGIDKVMDSLRKSQKRQLEIIRQKKKENNKKKDTFININNYGSNNRN